MDDLTVLAFRAKGGDRRALERFVAATEPDVHRLCSYLGAPADPDDLTQETFERALRSLHRFHGEGTARGWLMTIARRVCADSVRRRVRRERLFDLATSTQAVVHRDELWHDVTDALQVLDRDRFEAFVMTQFLGLSYADTAQALDCAIGTVRSRVARARAQLLELEAAGAAAEAGLAGSAAAEAEELRSA